jgi:SET domain
VQVEDPKLNRKLRHRFHGIRKSREPDWLLHNYFWDANNAMAEFDAMDVETIIPGLGMLANSHTGLVNAQLKSPRRFADLHRFLDPGAGASSTYHDVHFDALETIEAGAELYVGYGDDWFADREHLGKIPLSVDFKIADKALAMLANIGNDIHDDKAKSDFVVDALDLFVSVSRPRDRLMNAFPRTLSAFEQVKKRGTADLTVPNRVRSIDWLGFNGRCLDNIRPGISNIKQAGRGAFATRDLKQGEVVAPMPLVHLRRHHMEVYDTENSKAKPWRTGTQQLLNYCYSHPESSLLFYPYAPVVNYINHSFQSPNVEPRWSTLPNHQNSWLDRTPNDLDTSDHAGLIMELVATRDIEAGEEILINYGASWEQSWNEYVNSWEPMPENEIYVASAKLNQEIAWIRLTNETSEYPFSNTADLLTGCFVDLSEKVPSEEMPTYIWKGADDLFNTGDYLQICEIIEIQQHQHYDPHEIYDRQDSIKPVDVKYTVFLDMGRDETAKIINVPRKAIMFFDDQYMSDNFKRDSFRHEIHLPDHMIPEAWRDMK